MPIRLASLVVMCVAGAVCGGERGSKPAYRSFCYDDWLCEFMVNPSPLEPKHLDMLVDEAASGGADVLVINPAGMTTSHPSKVWQTMWKAYAAGNREAAFGSIPSAEVPDHEAMLTEMTRFSQLGIDYLAYTFAACRRRGVATGVRGRKGRRAWRHDGGVHPECSPANSEFEEEDCVVRQDSLLPGGFAKTGF
jgi:hypothetical protein